MIVAHLTDIHLNGSADLNKKLDFRKEVFDKAFAAAADEGARTDLAMAFLDATGETAAGEFMAAAAKKAGFGPS
jgi:hypothetical protein